MRPGVLVPTESDPVDSASDPSRRQSEAEHVHSRQEGDMVHRMIERPQRRVHR